MRYYRDSRRVIIKHFENLYSHEEIYFVVSDESEAIL